MYTWKSTHTGEDNNPGTLPLQSERLYSALKGLGKDSRLVMLPLESHSYQARESVLCVCVCVCACVRACVCLYVCMHACMYACMHV